MRETNNTSPPKRLRQVLEWLYGSDTVEDLIGDLDEIFYRNSELGKKTAAWEYNKQILSLLFSYGVKRRKRMQKKKYVESNYYIMHKSYLNLLVRSLRKDKLFSIIRLSNLVIGIAVSLLCWIYVRYELSYEKSFQNSEQIYRLQHQTPDKIWAAVPRAAGVYASENFQAVISMVRFSPASTLVRLDEKVFMEDEILFSDSTVFKVFDYEFVAGSPDKSLTNPHSVVLTESSAKKYFGNNEAVGKQLLFEFDRGEPREVTGVIKDPPSNSHLQFDFLASIYSENPEYNRSWSNWGTYAYLLMKPGSDLNSIGAGIEAEYIKQYKMEDDSSLKTIFMPLEKIHLYSNGEKELSVNANINYLCIFSFAGFFVLIISMLNFINLTLAKSSDRGREVGIRKSIGASKGSLAVQFLSESYLQVIISSLLGISLVYLILPFFRELSGLPLPFSLWQPDIILPVVILVLVAGLICGIYPSMIISKFKPAEILKSNMSNAGTKTGDTRQILSIVQFVISAILIIGSIIIYRQSQFIRERDLGFEKDQVITTRLNYSMNVKLDVFESELKRVPGIIEVSHSSSIPGYRIMREGVTDVSSGISPTNRLLLTSESFIESFDLQIIKGRGFTKNSNEPKGEWILNEEAVKAYFEVEEVDPIGRNLAWGGDTAEVVGIVKNFNFETLHEEVSPLAIYREPRARSYLAIRFEAGKIEGVLRNINKVYGEVYSNLPKAEFEFLSHRFETLYNAENKLQTLIFIFCALSLLLTISGIFALAVHYTKKKTKEIAIRKVLGSSVLNVIVLISRHFAIMVIISFVISIPLSYYLTNWWLEQFAYKINMGIITFITGGFSILLIVLLSSLYTTINTAITNPVKWLRNE